MKKRVVLTTHEALELASECGALEPQEILRRHFERFHPRIALCTSFQAEGMAILDMAWRINPEVRVFTIDTGRLPQETYELIDRIRDHYRLQIEVYFPEAQHTEAMVNEHGLNLFYRGVDLRLLCCQVRKVLPLRRVLSTLDAWVTGLRRAQSPTRAHIRKVEVDDEHGGLVKVNPLADWTEDQVWGYIKEHDIPYHPFYGRGYTSIGCAPCTRPPTPGQDRRSGRWWWEGQMPKECGLHYALGTAQGGTGSAG